MAEVTKAKTREKGEGVHWFPTAHSLASTYTVRLYTIALFVLTDAQRIFSAGKPDRR